MIEVNKQISIPDTEIEISAVRSQGAGGQNVNKVATAIQLRFDIPASSLPETVKDRLLRLSDQRLSKEGVLIIKSQEFRSQERNHQAALQRLVDFVRRGTLVRKRRLATKPSAAARRERMDEKRRRGQIKARRGPVKDY